MNLEKHQKSPITFDDVKDKVFEFHDKPNARVFHQPSYRNFLVHNINGKWLYLGKILIIEQTIKWDGENSFTSGKYKIIVIYNPEYQKQITLNETDKGKSYF